MGMPTHTKPRLFYIRDIDRNPLGAVSVAGVPAASEDDDPSDEDSYLLALRPAIIVGVSVCHPIDEFSKPIARSIALGRLDKVGLVFPTAEYVSLRDALESLGFNGIFRRGVDWPHAEKNWRHMVQLARADLEPDPTDEEVVIDLTVEEATVPELVAVCPSARDQWARDKAAGTLDDEVQQ